MNDERLENPEDAYLRQVWQKEQDEIAERKALEEFEYECDKEAQALERAKLLREGEAEQARRSFYED